MTKKPIRQATPVNALRTSMTIAGGAVSYAPPPTPEPSTASRTGRGGHAHKHRDTGKDTRGSMTRQSGWADGG